MTTTTGTKGNDLVTAFRRALAAGAFLLAAHGLTPNFSRQKPEQQQFESGGR